MTTGIQKNIFKTVLKKDVNVPLSCWIAAEIGAEKGKYLIGLMHTDLYPQMVSESYDDCGIHQNLLTVCENKYAMMVYYESTGWI